MSRPRSDRSELVTAVAAVAVGGAVGALARYGVGLMAPLPDGTFPVATFAINVAGCLLIGVLVALVTEARIGHRLLRPFLGTGVLGGFTTFSTYAVESTQLLRTGHLATAGLYLAGTLVSAVLAASGGLLIGRRIGRRG